MSLVEELPVHTLTLAVVNLTYNFPFFFLFVNCDFANSGILCECCQYCFPGKGRNCFKSNQFNYVCSTVFIECPC